MDNEKDRNEWKNNKDKEYGHEYDNGYDNEYQRQFENVESSGKDTEREEGSSGGVPGYSRGFKIDYHSEDDWNDLDKDQDGYSDYKPDYVSDHDHIRDPDEKKGFSLPGFLKRLMYRGDEEPAEEGMTLEAKRQIRERIGGTFFDEEKDRHVAEESTRDVPPDLLEAKNSADNRTARRFEEADRQAAQEQDDRLVQEPSRPKVGGQGRVLRLKNSTIVGLVVLAVLLIFFLTAPMIQAGLFRTEGDSLIFNAGRGLFGPRSGILQIAIGILGGAMLFNTLKNQRGKRKNPDENRGKSRNRNLLRNISLVMLIFIPLGISSLFNFSELRNNDLRFSTIVNRDRTYDYEDITIQDVATRGEEIYYTLETHDGRSSRLNITEMERETIRLLDSKLSSQREVRFTSTAINRLVELGFYTREEAIQVLIDTE